jgi:hypothetical protein
MTDANKSELLDRIGVTASMVCAVHCILSPLPLALIPAAGLGVLADESAEWTLIAISISVGAISLLPSFLMHRRSMALSFFAAGALIIFAARSVLSEGSMGETCVAVIGALCIAASHLINRRLCRSCPSCRD